MLRFKRAILGLAGALALLGSATPAESQVGASWQPNDDDSLLFDTRLGQYRLGDGVRGYQTPDGICLNLPDMIVTLDIPIEVDTAKGVAQGWVFDERNQLKIDRISGKVRIADRQHNLTPMVIRDTPEGWCVLAASIASWLEIQLVPDLSNSLLVMSSKTKLPVQLAAERRARAARVRPVEQLDLSAMPQAKLPYRLWRTPSLDAVVTVGGLSDKRQGRRLDREYNLYASGEVAKMSVDARLSSNREGLPSDFRLRAYRSDIEGKLLGPLGATHFEVGDVSSPSSPLVAQSMSGRGFMVTNRPLGRPETFDRKTFRGELPTGWDAELYRNGQLLAAAQNRSDGRYEFIDVPLLFGQNRIEIVLYGPQGQVRRNRETIAVGPESIPPKETWYWASISEDAKNLISWDHDEKFDQRRGWRGAIGLERGIDQLTSLSAQVHSLVINDERLTYVEGAVRRSVGPALIEISGSYETGGGMAARAQLLGQFGETYVVAESIIARDYLSDRVFRNVTGLHSIGIQHSFDLGKVILPVTMEGRYVQRLGGNDSLEAGARISTTISRFSITGAVDWRMSRSGSGPDPPQQIEAALLGNGAFGKTRVRGELRWRLSPVSRFESAALIAERRIGERTALRGEIGYDRGLDRVRGGLGYVRQFNKFALSLTGEAASDGSVAAGLNLALSLGPNPNGGFRVSSQKLASNGSVFARVFRDDNGDGLRSVGESFEKDVQIMVARMPTEKTTDERGEIMIDGLEPHRPVRIGVDASSLPDPLIQPAGPGVSVTPRPGLPISIELPLVSAGEVLGTLIGANGSALEGMDIELVGKNGQVIATARSDFDGFFLFESVPYGDYKLRLNKLSASVVGAPADLYTSVTLGKNSPTARLGRVGLWQPASMRLAYQDVLMEPIAIGPVITGGR
jgi:hypothetical protein